MFIGLSPQLQITEWKFGEDSGVKNNFGNSRSGGELNWVFKMLLLVMKNCILLETYTITK